MWFHFLSPPMGSFWNDLLVSTCREGFTHSWWPRSGSNWDSKWNSLLFAVVVLRRCSSLRRSMASVIWMSRSPSHKYVGQVLQRHFWKQSFWQKWTPTLCLIRDNYTSWFQEGWGGRRRKGFRCLKLNQPLIKCFILANDEPTCPLLASWLGVIWYRILCNLKCSQINIKIQFDKRSCAQSYHSG